MTAYADVKYKRSTITLSGATEATPAEGDIWYQSGKFYFGTSESFVGAWSSGGSLTTARSYAPTLGTQTAAVTCGGRISAYVRTTEEYNGTVWSNGGI